jgi:hypothetical protein
MHLDDLDLDGHRYDARVLAAPLEHLHLLRQVSRQPGPDRSGLSALLLGDLEWQLDSVAADVHRVVLHRAADEVCSCGLVMSGADVVTSRGHRDLRTRRIAEGPYAVSHGQGDAERFAVVCPYCGLGSVAVSLDAAQRARAGHDCRDDAGLMTPDELQLALEH